MLVSIGRTTVSIALALGLVAGELIMPLPVGRAQDNEPTTVRISASDYEFQLDGTIIPAGRVRFEVVNTSSEVRHEVWVYPSDQRDSPRFDEMLELKRTGQRANERDFIDDILGNSGEIEPGQTASFEAFLPPGLYELACLARDGEGDDRLVHYEHGMFAALVAIEQM